jgi:hypothetical protein
MRKSERIRFTATTDSRPNELGTRQGCGLPLRPIAICRVAPATRSTSTFRVTAMLEKHASGGPRPHCRFFTNRRPRQRQPRGARRLLLRGCGRLERQRPPRGCVGDDAGAAPSSLTPILALGFGAIARAVVWVRAQPVARLVPWQDAGLGAPRLGSPSARRLSRCRLWSYAATRSAMTPPTARRGKAGVTESGCALHARRRNIQAWRRRPRLGSAKADAGGCPIGCSTACERQ